MFTKDPSSWRFFVLFFYPMQSCADVRPICPIPYFCPQYVQYGVISMNISPSLRALHVCWWSPLRNLTKASVTLCHLLPAKEISVITCSFLNIIKHRPFHHSECVTFRVTTFLSMTDRSCEVKWWSIFISLFLMWPKNRVFRWAPVLSSSFEALVHLPENTPRRHQSSRCFIFRRPQN